MIEIGRKKIGEHEVFSNQWKAAFDILDVFRRKAGPPLLIGECQSGKNGVAVIVIEEFLRDCESQGITEDQREIIYAINIADNELKGQNRTRLLEAGLLSKVKVFHHNDYKNYEPQKNIKARLVIVDECHEALGKSTEKLKPFHEFLKKCGVFYGEPCYKWENKNNYILSISATPYAQIVRKHIDEQCFEIVVLERDEQYYSLEKMRMDNRLHKSEPLMSKGEISSWFKNRFEEYLERCDKSGNGILILRFNKKRNSKKDESAIVEYINEEYGSGVDVQVYDCHTGNIGDLTNDISINLPKPLVAIVKGSLRAGKTLPTTRNIRMMIDSPNSKASTVVQGFVGRVLGYPCRDGHKKFDDNFPVYCNIAEIDEAISFYKDQRYVPSSTWNDPNTETKKYIWKIMLLEKDSEEANDFVEKIDKEKEYSKLIISERSSLESRWDSLPVEKQGEYKDIEDFIDQKVKHIESQTAMHTQNKNSLIKELQETFDNALWDENDSVFRSTKGPRVSRYMRYEYLDGCPDEKKEEYDILFKKMDKNIEIDKNKKYVIVYEKEEFSDTKIIHSNDKILKKDGILVKSGV